LAVQALLAAVTGEWWAGAAAGAGLFAGREIAQAEYRWIERFGEGRRANLQWWGAFDPRVWDRHSLAGAVLPLLAASAFAWKHQRPQPAVRFVTRNRLAEEGWWSRGGSNP
jgi:hypothetical protein